MVKTRVRCAGSSDAGRVRRNNEDSFYIDAERGVFLVVDGIGGQAAGEKAAELARERVKARLERQIGGVEQRVREAIAMANNEIFAAARSNKSWEGMACVLTVAALDNGSVVVGHVGDSRLYMIRGGSIRKITHDHSPVGEREDSGELSEAEAMRHPRRNEVYRDVGSEEHAPEDPDFIESLRFPFEADSALVLCSDGLSDLVPSAEIRRAVERNAGDPEAAVRELIDAANRAGGKDNVTVLVVEGERFAAPAAAAPVENRMPFAASRWAFLVYGMLIAAAALWAVFGEKVRSRPPEAPPAPAVLTVGQGGQFATIGAAMMEAKTGDTVDVLPGEYAEQVTLKSGVALRSRNLGQALLRAAPLSQGPAVAGSGVKDARFTGFRIVADPSAPLAAGISLSDSEVEINDVEIASAAVGIEIRGGASPALRANSIHDCSESGILISGPSQPWVSHNLLRANKVGVAARDGARPALVGNVFDKSPLELPPEVSMKDVRALNTFLNVRAPQPRAAASKGEVK